MSLQPHIANASAVHRGDMVQAVQDPRVVEGIRDQLGYRPYWEYVYAYEDDSFPSGEHLVNQLEVDDRALGEVRTAVNELRAWVGVEPIDERHLLTAAGIETTDSLDVSEARSVSTRTNDVTGCQNAPGANTSQHPRSRSSLTVLTGTGQPAPYARWPPATAFALQASDGAPPSTEGKS